MPTWGYKFQHLSPRQRANTLSGFIICVIPWRHSLLCEHTFYSRGVLWVRIGTLVCRCMISLKDNATAVKVSVDSTTLSRCDLWELFSNSQTIISLGNRQKAQSRTSVAKLNRQLVALSLNATLVAAALNLLCELLPLFFISLPEECL